MRVIGIPGWSAAGGCRVLLTSCVVLGPVWAALANPQDEDRRARPPIERATVVEDSTAVAAEIEAATAALAASTDDADTAAEWTARLDLLHRLDRTYAQTLSALDHQAELTAARARLESELQTLKLRGLQTPPPYPFTLLESLRDQAETEAARAQSRTDAVDAAKASLATARERLEQKERARRLAKEAFEKQDSVGHLAAAFQAARLDSRVARAELDLRELELDNQKLEQTVHGLRLDVLHTRIARIARDVRFARDELDTYVAELDQKEAELNRALALAQREFTLRDAEWMAARRRLESSAEPAAELVEEFAARESARRTRQRDVALLGEQLEAVIDQRTAWNRRYAVFQNEVDEATIGVWRRETREVLDQIARDIRINSNRLTELRREALALQSRIDGATDASPETRQWLERQRTQLLAMIESYAVTIAGLETAGSVHRKLLDEISTQSEGVPWSQRLSNLWAMFQSVWHYEITSVQDNPITVRKIVIGFALLLVGLFLSRRIVEFFGQRFLPRLGLNEGAIAAIQSLLFYVLIVTVAMISLRIVNVPLTAFTILGGALAIGIGFGSQNIVNNFISGLILLVERPIRVGDLVHIADLVGVVEHIGPRSTRVRSPENVDIIVPNSSFLQDNVINWTLTDDRYRTHISVGVAYGSPTRDVIRLIRKALDEHGKVLAKPEPIVLFSDFGDNALVFEAHFWVRMRRMMERRIIESDIRSRIDSLFREAGIVVAFPQRDVHLDTTRPIDVRLRSPDTADGVDAPQDD